VGFYWEILRFKESVQLFIEKKIKKTETKTSGADSNDTVALKTILRNKVVIYITVQYKPSWR